VGRGTGKFGRARLLPSQNGSEWRVANSEWFSGGQRSCAAEKFFDF
jgi:hypothetical protein